MGVPSYALRYYYPDRKSLVSMQFSEDMRKNIASYQRRLYDHVVGRKKSYLAFFIKPDGNPIPLGKIDRPGLNKFLEKKTKGYKKFFTKL